MNLSTHFTAEEFACKCGCGFGTKPGDVDPDLLRGLEAIREAYGSMTVVSGCRCKAHNTAVGGVPSSTHQFGLGVDISAPSGAEKFRLVQLAQAAGFERIGVGKSFIHLDTAAKGETWPSPAIWQYGRA